MIDAEVKVRADGKSDLYIRDGGNHEDLLNSNQGYERIERPVEIARRLFGPDGNAEAIEQISRLLADYPDQTPLVTEIRRIIAGRRDPEPVQLTVTLTRGGTHEEDLR